MILWEALKVNPPDLNIFSEAPPKITYHYSMVFYPKKIKQILNLFVVVVAVQVVEKMSHQEKAKLKEEIANSVPKDVRELLGDRAMTDDEETADQVKHQGGISIKFVLF